MWPPPTDTSLLSAGLGERNAKNRRTFSEEKGSDARLSALHWDSLRLVPTYESKKSVEIPRLCGEDLRGGGEGKWESWLGAEGMRT